MGEGYEVETEWNCVRVEGPLDFALIGILASLASQLAEAGVSIFAVSTYDTDYILIKTKDFPTAIDTLKKAGHRVGEQSH